MSRTTITGENIFRARTVISFADILALDTVPIELAPAIPGKTIAPISAFFTYNWVSVNLTVGTGRAEIFFGTSNAGLAALGANEVVSALTAGKAQSQFKSLVGTDLAAGNLTAVQGEGLYLVETATGFASTTGSSAMTIEIDVLYQVLPA